MEVGANVENDLNYFNPTPILKYKIIEYTIFCIHMLYLHVNINNIYSKYKFFCLQI